MENTANNSTARIYVKDLSVERGLCVSLKKQDGSEFFDSDVDKVARKSSEYSEFGSSSIERLGSSLIVVFEELHEGRNFIEGVAYKNNNTNIKNNIKVIFSRNHYTWGEVSLTRRKGGSFADAEIQSIFWIAFQYTSLSSFSPCNNKTEVLIHFKDIGEWDEFIQQFGYDDEKKRDTKNES